MKTTVKRWAGLGLGTAFLGTSLVACGSDTEVATPEAPAADAAAEAVASADAPIADQTKAPAVSDTTVVDAAAGEGEGGEGEGGEGEGGEAGPAMDTLPLPQRLAFMTGHVKAGLALYRANEPQMAAPHLLHPVSETHQAERAGLDDLGFDASIFEAVSKALEEGRSASEIEPQLVAAEKNLADVSAKAGGSDVEVIRFLMETIVEEYSIALTDGAVSDPGEYQDAYGFAIVARERANAFSPQSDDLIAALDDLVALWPDAPVPPADPTPIGKVIAQTSTVILTLPAL
ncbi:MAG: hypothetical protein AAF850_07415 [Pseudomonadota bacterium]